ncbi:MAG: prepilin-type N-terminal cleavage/methylation domain-containing protein [Betaproteobacteria bacterium]|jgi:type IV fimbrial biogenesis protein FimT|nr:MAG: prepilin-type N-terminal cleavage/methylation domain-containing protein [Betaproteobacteria bacterium]TMH36769.1 MAG: prepilin-type N-terminal cleavage/methylation domain-containing protein [Betaproteobacteria bacterium]
MKQQTSRRSPSRGLTLIETTIAIAIAAIIVSVAVPSFRSMQERRTLEGRANELATDIHFVRSEAVTRNLSVRMSFRTSAAGSCYVIHTGAATDCTCSVDAATQCSAGALEVKTVRLPAASGIALYSNVSSMLFAATHGTTSPTGTLRLLDSQGKAIHHVVNIMGRVRSCSPQGDIPGYRAC